MSDDNAPDLLAAIAEAVMESLDAHGGSYRLPKRPSDLAHLIADDLIAAGLVGPITVADGGTLNVSASTVALATPSSEPSVEPGLDVEWFAFALWAEFGYGDPDEDHDGPPKPLDPTHEYWRAAADRLLARLAKPVENDSDRWQMVEVDGGYLIQEVDSGRMLTYGAGARAVRRYLAQPVETGDLPE